MSGTKTAEPMLTWPPEFFAAVEEQRRAERVHNDADRALVAALDRRDRADREAEELRRIGVDMANVISNEEALATGAPSGTVVSYLQHKRPEPGRIEELEKRLEDAAVVVEQARAEVERRRKPTWNIEAECRKTKTRWYALTDLKLAGVAYPKHSPVPPDALMNLPANKRARWVARRMLGELP